ncbi:uncharacterized protein TNCV_3578812 [Trichonephila clavipes]|nr:uncharacterized protein TNCV_3578812 [Trichonephila clavipes]
MLGFSPILADQRASRKMATSKQKAFCVLQFAKTESAVTVQRAFRIKFDCQPPNHNIILKLYHQFETTGCLCKGKSTGPYEGRKGSGHEAMRLSDMEKNKKHSSSVSSYYPQPYATTHLSGRGRSDDGTDSGYHQEEPLYATVKRTPRPPRSDGHIYHCPVHTLPVLVREGFSLHSLTIFPFICLLIGESFHYPPPMNPLCPGHVFDSR